MGTEQKQIVIKRLLDHIVYAVHDLDATIIHFEKKLGTVPIFGGYHTTQGTKNALINLDKGVYLELLAADEANTEVPPPRWMGVDVLTKNQITRWALKSGDLDQDSSILKQYNTEMGSIKGGSRNTAKGALLKWQLALPLAEPEVELMPFMVDWSLTETHPHDELPNMGCELIKLYGTHPNPDLYVETLEKLELIFPIEKSEEISLKAIIKCPKGIVEI